MPANQVQVLVAIYKKMPTPEIESRIHSGQLTMLAKLVAETELADRKSRPESAPLPVLALAGTGKGDERTRKQVLLTQVGGSLVIGATAYWIMPSELFVLMAFVLVIGVAKVLGKARPTFGITVGVLVTASPVFLGAYLWHTGELAWKGGDYRPLNALIYWGFLIFASMLAVGLGSAFIRGARHKGSWAQLEADINTERNHAIQDMRKLD